MKTCSVEGRGRSRRRFVGLLTWIKHDPFNWETSKGPHFTIERVHHTYTLYRNLGNGTGFEKVLSDNKLTPLQEFADYLTRNQK